MIILAGFYPLLTEFTCSYIKYNLCFCFEADAKLRLQICDKLRQGVKAFTKQLPVQDHHVVWS